MKVASEPMVRFVSVTSDVLKSKVAVPVSDRSPSWRTWSVSPMTDAEL